ncbi:aquaporin AQPAn.G-like [Ptychodera flava]|uniref:aquaporin AQPAn.G-like n=1 Tax=Ptychodera flava TaxID=63121 RepID=UPI003969CE7C
MGNSKELWDVKDLSTLTFWRAILGEALATFLFVFIVCSAIVPIHEVIGNGLKILQIAFTVGLAIATLVHCFGDVSGAHINPAVTVAMLMTARAGVFRALFYVAAQCSGAIGGAAVVYGLTPKDGRGNLGVTLVNDRLTEAQGFGMEFMLTFVLVFTVFATVDPKRTLKGSPAIAIGLAVLIDHLIGITYTGASMNPARTLGPAVIMGIYDLFWVYWVGPLAGGVVAGWIYVLIFGRTLKSAASTKQEKEETRDYSASTVVGVDNASFANTQTDFDTPL